MDVLYVRREATADASLAAIFARTKFGIAIAAMIKMMATTINNSINENPFCLFRMIPPNKILSFVLPMPDIKQALCHTGKMGKTNRAVVCKWLFFNRLGAWF